MPHSIVDGGVGSSPRLIIMTESEEEAEMDGNEGRKVDAGSECPPNRKREAEEEDGSPATSSASTAAFTAAAAAPRFYGGSSSRSDASIVGGTAGRAARLDGSEEPSTFSPPLSPKSASGVSARDRGTDLEADPEFVELGMLSQSSADFSADEAVELLASAGLGMVVLTPPPSSPPPSSRRAAAAMEDSSRPVRLSPSPPPPPPPPMAEAGEAAGGLEDLSMPPLSCTESTFRRMDESGIGLGVEIPVGDLALACAADGGGGGGGGSSPPPPPPPPPPPLRGGGASSASLISTPSVIPVAAPADGLSGSITSRMAESGLGIGFAFRTPIVVTTKKTIENISSLAIRGGDFGDDEEDEVEGSGAGVATKEEEEEEEKEDARRTLPLPLSPSAFEGRDGSARWSTAATHVTTVSAAATASEEGWSTAATHDASAAAAVVSPLAATRTGDEGGGFPTPVATGRSPLPASSLSDPPEDGDENDGKEIEDGDGGAVGGLVRLFEDLASGRVLGEMSSSSSSSPARQKDWVSLMKEGEDDKDGPSAEAEGPKSNIMEEPRRETDADGSGEGGAAIASAARGGGSSGDDSDAGTFSTYPSSKAVLSPMPTLPFSPAAASLPLSPPRRSSYLHPPPPLRVAAASPPPAARETLLPPSPPPSSPPPLSPRAGRFLHPSASAPAPALAETTTPSPTSLSLEMAPSSSVRTLGSFASLRALDLTAATSTTRYDDESVRTFEIEDAVEAKWNRLAAESSSAAATAAAAAAAADRGRGEAGANQPGQQQQPSLRGAVGAQDREGRGGGGDDSVIDAVAAKMREFALRPLASSSIDGDGDASGGAASAGAHPPAGEEGGAGEDSYPYPSLLASSSSLSSPPLYPAPVPPPPPPPPDSLAPPPSPPPPPPIPPASTPAPPRVIVGVGSSRERSLPGAYSVRGVVPRYGRRGGPARSARPPPPERIESSMIAVEATLVECDDEEGAGAGAVVAAARSGDEEEGGSAADGGGVSLSLASASSAPTALCRRVSSFSFRAAQRGGKRRQQGWWCRPCCPILLSSSLSRTVKIAIALLVGAAVVALVAGLSVSLTRQNSAASGGGGGAAPSSSAPVRGDEGALPGGEEDGSSDDAGGGSNSNPPSSPSSFWRLVPDSIDGRYEGGNFGSAVSANRYGTRVAVGSPDAYSTEEEEEEEDGVMRRRRGLVQVYRLAAEGEGGWVQVGNDIWTSAREEEEEGGEGDEDGSDSDGDGGGNATAFPRVRSPLRVELSGDGSTVAVGSAFHDAAGVNGTTRRDAGLAEVFKFDTDADEWVRMGEPIVGRHASDFLGASISLSEYGGKLAVGKPGCDELPEGSSGGDRDVEEEEIDAGAAQVYIYNNGVWVPLGDDDIRGTVPGEMLGTSVSLTPDGRTIAVGGTSHGPDGIVARVYDFGGRGGTWREVGEGIEGGAGLHDTAYEAVLSSDGRRVVVSNHYVGEGGPEVRADGRNDDLFVGAYRYDDTTASWELIGRNLHANSPGDKSGYFISLSDDGNVIGMGDPGRSSGPDGWKRVWSGHAHVYVYDEDGDEFKQVGPNIEGEAAADRFGYEVSVSGDGRRFVIGAPSSRGNGFEHGRVQVYEVPLPD